MREHSGAYVPRDVEATVLAHLDAVLDAPASRPELMVLAGEPGNGVRAILERGIAPRLAERSRFRTATVRDEWHPDAHIQLCLDADDVPAHPPDPRGTTRAVLLAASAGTTLPSWVAAAGPRNFPVGTLTLAEAEALLTVIVGGHVEPTAVRRLGRLAGFVPGMLALIVEACRDRGCLERVGETWQLTADPVRHAVVPLVRAELTAFTAASHAALFRIALAEPVHPRELGAEELALVADRVATGDLHRQGDGFLAFRAPGVAEALRLLSPAEEQDRVHSAARAEGRLRLDTIRWATLRDESLPVGALLRFARERLDAHDWDAVVAAAEFLEATSAPAEESADRCRIYLAGAYAARFVPDLDLTHGYLDRAEELLEGLGAGERAETHAQILAGRADLLHFSLGDLDAALRTLDTPTAASSAVVAANRVVHLVYAGRVREARERIRSDRRVLRRGPRPLQMRIALAETLALAAEGRPQRALRRTMLTAARHAPTRGRTVWLDEEIRVSYVVAALGSDGPAAYPSLARLLDDTRDELLRPDLMTFYLARATWLLMEGDVAGAHRISELTLGSGDLVDPSGVRAGLVALAAETAALSGDQVRAAELLELFDEVPLRSAGVVRGGVEAHLASARLLLERPHEGTALRRIAERFADDGLFGFAAEVLYAGVRAGRRRAASDLREIGPRLDGRLHAMRVAHAVALLDEDAMALFEVSGRLDRAGLALYAAEAAAAAAKLPRAPDAVRRRAEDRVAAFRERQPVPGNRRLTRAGGAVGGTSLTPREREVSALIAEGLTNAEIADRLSLSLRTVEGHIARLYRKTGASRRAPGRAAGVVQPRLPQGSSSRTPNRR